MMSARNILLQNVFEVLVALSAEITVILDVTPCSLVELYCYFNSLSACMMKKQVPLKQWYLFVTIRLNLNFIIGCWGYTLDREERVGVIHLIERRELVSGGGSCNGLYSS
jgi:hypothetical protein